MRCLGTVLSIARFPVKSMAGESLTDVHLTRDGMEGDRLFAFESPQAPPGMLRLHGNQRRAMLQYHACCNSGGEVAVQTPSGATVSVDDPQLAGVLALDQAPLRLTSSPTPQTDVRPLSLLSRQTIDRLSAEFGSALDLRRFRSNLVLDLPGSFVLEDAVAGTHLDVGGATLELLERIPRCRFITYDPEVPVSSEPLFALMRFLGRTQDGRVGRYARVIQPGRIAVGDPVLAQAPGTDL